MTDWPHFQSVDKITWDKIDAAVIRSMGRQRSSLGATKYHSQFVALLWNARKIAGFLLKHRNKGHSRHS